MNESFQISSSLAQTIVDAAKEVIGKHINFMQLNGKIIASTDPSRVNSFHEAAFQVHEKGSTIEVTENNLFKGTKRGINYPVIIDGQMLGIIGISGDPEECQTLGFLLTKITEVLIKEQMMLSKGHSLDEQRSAIVRMLIFEHDKRQAFMQEILEQLHYALEEKAFAAIIHLHGWDNSSASRVHHLFLKNSIKLFTYVFPNQYVLIMNESNYEAVIQSLPASLTAIQRDFSVGIGGITSLAELEHSYKKAKLALKYALLKQASICEYERLDLEIMLENIDPHIKNDYAVKLIGKLSKEEVALLHTYYEHDLSLKKTAEELFIHKNTLQYRLDKIAQKTGANPRNYHDSVKLYIALLLQAL